MAQHILFRIIHLSAGRSTTGYVVVPGSAWNRRRLVMFVDMFAKNLSKRSRSWIRDSFQKILLQLCRPRKLHPASFPITCDRFPRNRSPPSRAPRVGGRLRYVFLLRAARGARSAHRFLVFSGVIRIGGQGRLIMRMRIGTGIHVYITIVTPVHTWLLGCA